jgi:membrane complex biogenesis BtpA family protein
MEDNKITQPRKLFHENKLLIGMIHVPALPGTPSNTMSPKQIIEKCIYEASLYHKYNVDSIMIENMHDIPYLKKNVGPEIVSMMSIIAYEIRKVFSSKTPLGIQILAGANKEAIAVAHSSHFNYIRAEGFVFSHVADEGIFESDAGELLRYRKQIGADTVKVFTDIKKKHSSNFITNDLSIAEIAKNAEYFLSDGIVITGSSTGAEADIEEVISVRKQTNLPILIGSGITYDNIDNYYNYSDGFIIGSYFKNKGYWKNDMDEMRIREFSEKFKGLSDGISA